MYHASVAFPYGGLDAKLINRGLLTAESENTGQGPWQGGRHCLYQGSLSADASVISVAAITTSEGPPRD